MDKISKIIIFFIIIALFTGCTSQTTPSEALSIQNEGVLSISYEPSSDIVILSYPDLEFESLNRVTYETTDQENSLAYTAAQSLLSGKNAENNYIPFSNVASIQSFFVSRNVVLMDIRVDLSLMTQLEYFSSVISLTNTLTEIEGIEYVKLKINGEDLRPIGILTNPLVHNGGDLDVLYLQHMASISSNNSPQPSSTSDYLLFFTDLSGKYLLAEVRSSSLIGENLAIDLINQLKNGPAASDEMKSIIPKNVILQKEPQVHSDGEFGNILTISLEAPKHEAMDSEARYMIAASIVATMLSNITGIDAVRIFINSQPAISTSIMTEKMFYEKIGNIATLYFPNSDYSYLIPIKRAFSQSEYTLEEKRIQSLIEGLLDYESDSAQNVFPENLKIDDLISIKVSNGIAFVDFTSDLILSCDYNRAQESMLVYSVVNTLAEFKEIKRVQITINGKIQKTLCGYLSSEEPFLPNPGIIQK